MSTRITLAAATLLLAACSTGNEMWAQAPVDESEIRNVWHQAKLRGVSFRAIGQEPGWLLEITDGTEILLALDYGQSRNSYPWIEPAVDQAARSTRFRSDDIDILIEGRDCRDPMSGESFAVTVTVRVGDRTLAGCGRALH